MVDPRLDLGSPWVPYHHRSGWSYAMSGLRPLHADNGVLFDGFIEKRFAWGRDPGDRYNAWEPYRRPWVGVLHNPPDIPSWFNLNQQSPNDIIMTATWRESLRNCRGLFTLSDYLKRWLAARVDVPVCSLVHPTETPTLRFNVARYLATREPRLIQVGWWLRRYSTLFNLRLQRTRKILLNVGDRWMNDILAYELDRFVEPFRRDTVEMLAFVDGTRYDELLSESVVLLHLYDSSANNALIECIVRETPVLVNRLEATVEYLGASYPLYFDTLEEAASKVEDSAVVVRAHEYLRALPKCQFSREHFADSIARSPIYQAL